MTDESERGDVDATTIRPMQARDVSGVVALMAEANRYYVTRGYIDPVSTETIEAELRRAPPGVEILLALAPTEMPVALAGFSLLYPNLGSQPGAMLYLKDLYVAEAWRRRGIARRLIATLAAIARDSGCARMGWTGPADDPDALAFYDGLGARRIESLVSFRLQGAAMTGLADTVWDRTGI